MEEAYLILFKVNQLIIPGIYIVLVVLSMVLGQVQLVALLVAVVIIVHECCTVAQNKTLFQIGESYENT